MVLGDITSNEWRFYKQNVLRLKHNWYTFLFVKRQSKCQIATFKALSTWTVRVEILGNENPLFGRGRVLVIGCLSYYGRMTLGKSLLDWIFFKISKVSFSWHKVVILLKYSSHHYQLLHSFTAWEVKQLLYLKIHFRMVLFPDRKSITVKIPLSYD